MKTIRIEGELFRSHENGLKEGLEEGKEIGHASGLEEGRSDTERKFILKLLEKYSPREISRDYDVPLERVMEIKNENK